MLIAHLNTTIAQFSADSRFLVALSGGLDSQVLLHLMSELAVEQPLQLQAIHIHHGLSPNANQWAQFCQNSCDQLNIPLTIDYLHLDHHQQSNLEQVAREARYGAFKQLMTANTILITAHHQDDQAETVLLQILRGSGLQGLCGMRAVKPFALGWHWRPLLDVSRQDLVKIAQQKHIDWIEDESNLNVKFRRNFLRQQIFPQLQTVWPSYKKMLAKTARHCQDTEALLDDFIRQQLQALGGQHANTLSISKLAIQPEYAQRILLRAWLVQYTHYPPNEKRLAAMLEQMQQAAWDRMPIIYWGEYALRRYRDELFVTRKLLHKVVCLDVTWSMMKPLQLPDGRQLLAQSSQGSGVVTTLPVRIKYLSKTAKLKLAPHAASQQLGKLWQKWGVPPWCRAVTPIILTHDDIWLATPGYAVNRHYQAQANQIGWLFSLSF